MTNSITQIIRVHDIETGEIIDREMNDFEFAEYEKDKKAVAKAQLEEQTKATAKAVLLDKLGITAEEAALLLS
jgi:hypothetical protein